MKKITILWLLVILIPVAALGIALMLSPETIVYSVLIFGIYWIIAFATSVKKVPQNNVMVTEIFGKYAKQRKAGLNFLIPFGIEKAASLVYLGQQMMKLYLDETVKDGFGAGDVEFKDCSGVGVSAFLYFQFEDAYKCTYAVDNLFGSIEEKADGILRVNFMMYTLDEAMNLKGKLTLENIACYTNLLDGVPSPTLATDYLKSEFHVTLREFGVEPKSFVISDFRLPQPIMEQRIKKLAAEKDKEVAQITLEKAEIEKQTTITEAQGKSEAKALNGKGEAARITHVLAAAKLEAGQNAAYLTEIRKWDAIAESKSGDKVILIEGNGEASNGAKFGTGLNATKK